MSPPARRVIALVGLNHSLSNCQWSGGSFGESGDFSLFSFRCVLTEKFAKMPKVRCFSVFYDYAGPNWFFHTLVELYETSREYHRSEK